MVSRAAQPLGRLWRKQDQAVASIQHLNTALGDRVVVAEYLALGNPVSDILRNLVIEHTLQGNQFSPWLSTSRHCVEFNSATALKVPLKDLKDREDLAAFARGADCAIKQSLPGELRPGETWDEFTQRLFETEWVLKTASQLVLNESDAKVWRFEGFAAVVAAVASALSDAGYRIEAPPKANPCCGVEFPVKVKGMFRPQHMTWSDQQQIEFQAPLYLKNVVRIITETGLRVYNELLRMKREQVDLDNAVVWIPDSKIPNGITEVPLTSLVSEAFRDQIELAGKSEWLFPSDENPDGHQKTLKTVWHATLRRAGIRYFRIYDLRSTYATGLSAGGVADEWVTQLLRQGDANVFKK